MTRCVVICDQCHDKYQQPNRWQHLCEDCAKEQLDRHRRDTGHTELELRVVSMTADTISNRIAARRAFWVAKRMGL
jgi:hypothetical protein